MIPAIVLVSAYLIGGIPFGYLLVKLATGRDVREFGSGNIGATNAPELRCAPQLRQHVHVDAAGMIPRSDQERRTRSGGQPGARPLRFMQVRIGTSAPIPEPSSQKPLEATYGGPACCPA